MDLNRYAAFLSLPETIVTGPNRAIPIARERGVCASFYSPDDLDRKAYDFARLCAAENDGKILRAMDLGCSPYFPQAIRLAEAGFHVDAFDSEPPNAGLVRVNELLGERIRYSTIDAERLSDADVQDSYKIVYANRFLSHLRFDPARRLLRLIASHLCEGARLYLSFSGLDSPLGEGYGDRDKPVEDRYAVVNAALSRENQLAAAMCLYRPSDVEKLLDGLDVKIAEQWVSPGGALKYVVERGF